ncbi:MAG: hypothetical protein LBI03_11655, partial [Clostridiales bacterium]|nr:hypothetical protein [Clostridiales bacterium]
MFLLSLNSQSRGVGYIISYDYRKEGADSNEHYPTAYCEKVNERYISDLNCTDKKALWHLLACYFYGINEKVTIHTECRESSFKLLNNRKYKKTISILNTKKLQNYYSDKESAVKVTFTYDPKMIDNWRMEFIQVINITDKPCDLRDFLQYAELKNLSPEEVRKSRNFVLAVMNEHNLDIYRRLGEKVPLKIIRKIKFNNDTALIKYTKKLEEAGFKEGNRYWTSIPNEYCVYNNQLSIYQQVIYKNTKTYNDLSSARYFFRSIKKQRKRGDYNAVFDRFGIQREIHLIPYCNKLTWETEVKYFFENRNMNQKIFGKETPNTFDGYNLPGRYFRELGKLIGYTDAMRLINKMIDRYKELSNESSRSNFIHDWNILIEKFIDAKHLLTKGAIISCLDSSYNAALKICDLVEAINTTASFFLEGRKKNSEKMLKKIKNIRKELSCRIRKGQELESFLNEISEEVKRLNERKYNLSKEEKDKIAVYIDRMSKYIQHITDIALIKSLGRGFVKKMLTGNCTGLFYPKVYSLDTTLLCAEIMKVLKTNTRKARHLYNDFKQKGYLKNIQKGNITKEQKKEIETILRFRNCTISEEITSLQCFTAKVEEKCSPEFLVAGNASVCCMSFGSHKAIQYAKEEGIGVLNIYYMDRIIANSVLWIDDGYNCLVIDNVEVHPNYTKFKEQIKQLYMIAISGLMEDYGVTSAVQGDCYNDLNLYSSDDKHITIEERKAKRVENQYFYSDAHHAFVVRGEIDSKSNEEKQVFAYA